MDEFTIHMEELNSKLRHQKKNPSTASQQNIALQAEVCNGSDATSYFMSNSTSSSQLSKELPILEEVCILRGVE